MKLLLVDNLLFSGTRENPRFDLQPHLGLMSLAAVARTVGHKAEIYDPKRDLANGTLKLDQTLYEQIASRLLSAAPDAIGFTALGCNFHTVVRVATRIRKEVPDLPILLGGPHATILAREILETFAAFDVVVRSEAEQSILPVLEQLPDRNFADLPAVSFRSWRGEVIHHCGNAIIDDLDTLPMPAYDCYPLAEMGLESIRVEAGRGCPFSCTFCSTASFFGRNFRLKSTPRLLHEMETLHANHGFTDFKLNHDLFTVNRRKVVAFCEAVTGHGFTWACSARVDCVDSALLRLMHAAGCRRIYFGIEAGSARMQEITRKGLDLKLVPPILELTEELGIQTVTSYITGYPEEVEADQDETLDQVGWHHCRPSGFNDAQLHLLTPEPGTRLVAQYGPELKLDSHVSEFNFPRILPDDDDLLRLTPSIFANHYHFPTGMPRSRFVFMTSAWIALHDMGRTTLGYLLRAFEGRLSRLLKEAYDWWAKAGEPPGAILECLAKFFAERFGARSHLTSLIRYGTALQQLQKEDEKCGVTQAGRPNISRDDILSLSGRAVITKEIHERSKLMKKLADTPTAGLLDEALLGPVANYLIFRPAGERSLSSGAELYQLSGETVELLEAFAQPSSYWSCCLRLAEQESARLPVWEDIEQLHGMGVLEAHNVAASACAFASA